MNDFIQTLYFKEKINILLQCKNSDIPVLLVGQTGTGKTSTVETIFRNLRPIKFNFSAETTIDQLIGYQATNKTSEKAIVFRYGPFTEAFKDGRPLILDEFNMANEDVLQCIEGALDSKVLTIDDPINGIQEFEMNPLFKLIVIQNEAIDSFDNKRNKSYVKLASKFVKISFDEIPKEELFTIAKELSKHIPENDLNKLINFHFAWKEFIERNPDNALVCTIRNIKSTIQALSKKVSLFNSILLNYGSISSGVLEKMINVMNENDIKDSGEKLPFEMPKIPNCYMNTPLIESFKKIMFHLSQGLPILIVGDEECGKTQIAKWAGQYISKNEYNLMFCTPETTISDLVGDYIRIPNKEKKGSTPIRWVDGPIVKSIQENKYIIIDQIDYAQPQVIEGLKPLFDACSKKNKTAVFVVNGRPESQNIEIQDGFRIIATATKSEVKKLSPALLNRFAIIHVDNQLENITSEKIQELISKVAPKIKSKTTIPSRLNMRINGMTFSKLTRILKGIETLQNCVINELQLYVYLYALIIDNRIPLMQKNRNYFINQLGATGDFYFKKSEELENILAVIILLSKIGQPVILHGPTGIGKTSSAIALAKGLGFDTHKVCFNGETKASELFGNTTVKNGDFGSASGQLLSAMKNGGFFIADGIDSAEATALESLTNALEQKPGEKIFLPNNEEPITIHKKYFFIGCQNDTTMNEGKKLPRGFERKVVVLQYPFPEEESLQEVVNGIAKETSNELLTANLCKLVALINGHEKLQQKPWSFREIRRFFKRCAYFKNNKIIRTVDFNSVPEYYHAAFMIYTSFGNSNDIVDNIIDVISQAFELDKTKQEKLTKTLKEPVKCEADDNKIIMTKGDLIATTAKTSDLVDFRVSSFYESLFLISLIPKTEPILIAGPTSYKTFLAKQISMNPRIISLNRDSTSSLLFGNVVFAEKNTAISSLFDILILIARDPKLIASINVIKEIARNSSSIPRVTDVIDNLGKERKEFSFIIENVKKQIIEFYRNNDSSESYYSLKNYATIFNPGLVTSQILQQNTLILKNFAKLPIALIERFDELLSAVPELTLTEDYTNTIVPDDNHTIRFTNPTFRIIATCQEHDVGCLSESMLSRINLINVKSYNKIEYPFIFGDYYTKEINESFDFPTISHIISVAKGIYREIPKDVEYKQEDAIKLAIRLLSNKEKEAKGLECPLSIEDSKITSKFSDIKGTTRVLKLPESNILQVPSIQVLTDRIFHAFALNLPLIISGPSGNGKSKAVEFVAKCFGIKDHDIITIQLSHATTIDDLFGQIGIIEEEGRKSYDFVPTEFLRAVGQTTRNSDFNKKLVIIHGLNFASQSIIDSLIPIFDNNHDSRILQPNGITVQKRDYYIVGLSTGNLNFNEVYKSALTFTKEDYTQEEFSEIVSCIMKRENVHPKDIRFIENDIERLKKNPLNSENSDFLSVRKYDLYSYIKPLFIGAPYFFNSINGFCYVKKNPIPYIEVSKSTLDAMLISVEVNNDSAYTLYSNAIKTLNRNERELFVILAANKRKRFPLIIQGPTASGKTYTVQLFTKIIGQKLITLQMNSEYSSRAILGAYRSNIVLAPEKRMKLINKLRNCNPVFNDIIADINSEQKITQNNLIKWGRIINQRFENLLPNYKTRAKDVITFIENETNFFKNIEFTDSVITEAMVNGYWLLLDGIEEAPSDLVERILSLINISPTLNLYERGPKFNYSANPNPNQIKIHDNFRLIIAYNNDIESRCEKSILQAALSRGFIYTMKPFDDGLISLSLITYYNLPNKKFQGFDGKRLFAIHIADTHKILLKEENTTLTGRALLHVCKTIKQMKAMEITKECVLKILKSIYGKDVSNEFETEIKEDIVNKVIGLTQEIIDKSDLFINFMNSFIEKPIFSKVITSFKKVLFSKYKKVIYSIEETIGSILVDDDDFAESQGAFKLAILDVIYRIVDKMYAKFDGKETSLSIYTIDPSKYPEISLQISRLDYINYVIEKTRKTIFNFMIKDEEIKEVPPKVKNDLDESIMTFAFVQRDYSDLLDSIYREIYLSYRKCIEQHDLESVDKLYAFFQNIRSILSNNNSLTFDQLIQNITAKQARTFANQDLPVATESIAKFLSECKIKSAPKFEDGIINEFILSLIKDKKYSINNYQELKSIIEEINKQVNKMNKGVSFNFLNYKLENTGKVGREPAWFEVLAQYSSFENQLTNLREKGRCFEALIRLSSAIPADIFFKSFVGDHFEIDEKIIKILRKNAVVEYIQKMALINPKLLNPEIMIALLESFYLKTSPVSSSWLKQINKVNNILDINDKIIIPKIGNIHVRCYIKNTSKIIDDNNFRKTIADRQFLSLVNRYKQAFDILKESIGKTTEYHPKDAIPFIDNQIEYFNKNPEEAIFLSKHSNLAMLLKPSMSSPEEKSALSYGVFLLRLYSPRTLINFYSSIKEFPEDFKEIIGEGIREIVDERRLKKDQKQESSFALIASFILDPLPSYLLNYNGSILHGAITQVVMHSTEEKYLNSVRLMLKPFIKAYIGKMDEKSYKQEINSTDDRNFLFRPIQNFLNMNKEGFKAKANILKNAEAIDINDFKGKYNQIRVLLYYYKKFSEVALCFYESLQKLLCNYPIIIDNADKFAKIFKQLKQSPEIPGSKKFYIGYVHVKNGRISLKDDQNKERTYAGLKNGHYIFKLDENLIKNNPEISVFTLFIAPNVKPASKAPSYESFGSELTRFKEYYNSTPKESLSELKVDNYNKKVYNINFGTKTADDLIKFLNNIPDGDISNEIKQYSSIHFNASIKGALPTQCIKVFKEIEDMAKEYDVIRKALIAPEFEIMPSLSFVESSIEGGIKNAENLTFPFIKFDNDGNITANFKQINITAKNIIRGIQTTPLRINIYIFGVYDISDILIDPEDKKLKLPELTTEEGNNLLVINVPIKGLERDTDFKGKITINRSLSFNYNIAVRFIEPQFFIESPGNEFIYDKDHDRFCLTSSSFVGEYVQLRTCCAGLDELHQQILFQNISSLNNNPPVIGENKANYAKYMRGVSEQAKMLVKCQFSQEHQIEFVSHSIIKASNIYAAIYQNGFVPLEQNKADVNINLGNIFTKQYFHVEMRLINAEIPKFTIIPEHGVSVRFEGVDIKEASNRYSITLPFIAKLVEDKSTIKLNIETEQFGTQTFTVNVERKSVKAQYFVENSKEWSEKKIPDQKFTLMVTENSYEFQHKDPALNDQIHYDINTFTANDSYETLIIDNSSGNYDLHRGEGNGTDKSQSIVARYKRNKQYWWPTCIPGPMKRRLEIISKLDPERIEHVFSQILHFIGHARSLENYKKRIKSCESNKKAAVIQDILSHLLRGKYQRIKNKLFYIALPLTMKEIQEKQIELSDKYDPEKAKVCTDFFEQRLSEDEKNYEQLLSRKTPESNPVLALIGGEQKLMTKEERDKIIKSTPKNEIVTQIELSPMKGNVRRDMISFIATKTPLQIYEKLENILDLCQKFPFAVYSEWIEAKSHDKQYRDELIRAISMQFSIFYNMFKWSSDKRTLSNSPFICILNDFNASFRVLVNRLIDSGITIKPEIPKFAGALMNKVDLPHQEEINGDRPIEWSALVRREIPPRRRFRRRSPSRRSNSCK